MAAGNTSRRTFKCKGGAGDGGGKFGLFVASIDILSRLGNISMVASCVVLCFGWEKNDVCILVVPPSGRQLTHTTCT